MVFMMEGREHAVIRYNKESVKLDDDITMTLDLINVKNFMSGIFYIQTYEDFFSLQGVTVNAEFQAKAEVLGVEVHLDEPVICKNSVTVGASLSKEGFEGLNGVIPFLDVTFNVTKDMYFVENFSFGLKDLFYKKYGRSEMAKIPVYNLKSYEFISKHSTIFGFIKPEAFLAASGYLDSKADYSKFLKVGPKARKGVKPMHMIGKNGLADYLIMVGLLPKVE